MKTQRRHDIDWLRVITIGLLLIYHIAIIFQPWAMFIGFIRSEELLTDLWKPMTMLNIWRIPLLFFVSGMGLYFAMRKRDWKQLLVERTKRILLPFLFGVVAITPLHMFVFQKYYNLPLSYYPHQGHLWFLLNIFMYVLLLLPLFHFLKKRGDNAFLKHWKTLMSHPAGPLSISLFFVVEAMIVKPPYFALYAETWHGFFLGLLAFLFGYLFVYSGDAFWKTVKKWKWLYLALACVLYAIRYTVFATEAPPYLSAIESNCWIFALLGISYHYLNHPSRLLSYLSEGAYPIYIIHMFALFLGAWWILPLPIPGFFKFLAITGFTFLFCFLTYEFVIRRIAFLRPLFGLKGKRKPGVPTVPLADPNQDYSIETQK